jgi:hypothetical protein
LEVSTAGTLPGGSEFEESQSFSFRKKVEPKVLDLAFATQTVGGIQIELAELGGD